MEINRLFSEKAQAAAKRNETITEEMFKVAKQTMHVAEETEHETVSMRIITLVTLFYLPGTFISVSVAPEREVSNRAYGICHYHRHSWALKSFGSTQRSRRGKNSIPVLLWCCT